MMKEFLHCLAAPFVVWLAYKTNNHFGLISQKKGGMTYTDTVRLQGFQSMTAEYLNTNTWGIRPDHRSNS